MIIRQPSSRNAFHTIEEALDYLLSEPLNSDTFQIAMSDGYTFEGRPDRPMGKFTQGMIAIVMHLLKHDLEPVASERGHGFTNFRFSRIRMTSAADVPFPPDFAPQPVSLKNTEIFSMTPREMVAHFKTCPEDATDLIRQCENKRYTPSTLIEKVQSGYRVGWLSAVIQKHSVQFFARREDAVTDYLLFSLGKGRWNGTSEIPFGFAE